MSKTGSCARRKCFFRQISVLGFSVFCVCWFAEMPPARAQITAAVASNFVPTFEKVLPLLPTTITIVPGSTGKLFAQIHAGAPFDLFFSADEHAARQLVVDGLAVPESLRPYARGALVLWAAAGDAQSYFRDGSCRRVAMANPRVAPYGRAAQQVATYLKREAVLQPKIVLGENIQQVWQFVRTGNVDCGFIAMAHMRHASTGTAANSSYWIIPETFYDPIVQSAVVLRRARDRDAAQRVLDAFKTAEVKAIIERDGYLIAE